MDNHHSSPYLPQPSTSAAATGTPPPLHHLLQQQQQQLQMFWSYQCQEIEQVNDFKNHQLPLARIKKILKADEDVRMISAEALILFVKACELFILELTIRSWLHAEENKRHTLQKNDIAAAITRTDIFDFLVDIVPRDDSVGMLGGTANGVPYFYPPPMDPTAGIYGQPPSQAWQSVWQTTVEDGPYGTGDNGGQGQGKMQRPGRVKEVSRREKQIVGGDRGDTATESDDKTGGSRIGEESLEEMEDGFEMEKEENGNK